MARDRMNSPRGPSPRLVIDSVRDYRKAPPRGQGGLIRGERGRPIYFDDHHPRDSLGSHDRRRIDWRGPPRRPQESANYRMREARPYRDPRYPGDSVASSESSYDDRGYPQGARFGPRGRGIPPSPRGMGRPSSPRGITQPPSLRGRGRMQENIGPDRRDDFDDDSYGYGYAADDSSFSDMQRERSTNRRGQLLAVDHLNGSFHEYEGNWSRSIESGSIRNGSEGESLRTESMASSSVPSSAMPAWRRRATSWSSDTVSSYDRTVEYEEAKPSRDLPHGYLRRKDGVVLSMGSSMGSESQPTERYVDPESAAKAVVDNLALNGYEYSELGGINFSNSSNNSAAERYNINQTKGTPTVQPQKARNSRMSPIQADQDKRYNGPIRAPLKPLEEEKEQSEKKSTIRRAKVKNVDDATSRDGSRSTSSSVFRAKVKTPPGHGGSGSVSTISKTSSVPSNKGGLTAAKSEPQNARKPLKKSLKTSAANMILSQPSDTLAVKEFDASRIVEDTLSNPGTHFDESTISTKDQQGRRIPTLTQPLRSGCTDRAFASGECGTLERTVETVDKTVSRKSVIFCGEMPPPTKAGGRVPEMVSRFPADILPSVSDISSMPKSGQSTTSAIPFHGSTLDRMERFVEKLALTCRLAVSQPGLK